VIILQTPVPVLAINLLKTIKQSDDAVLHFTLFEHRNLTGIRKVNVDGCAGECAECQVPVNSGHLYPHWQYNI
jgi:hypothetical protein